MNSYKKAKEALLETEDYRNFTTRAKYLPEMLDKESAYFKEIQETYQEEGSNHLSVVELCRTFIKVDLLKLSLMQSTHGIFTDSKQPQYPTEKEVLDKFTLEKSKLDFYPLELPDELETVNKEIRQKVIDFNRQIEPFVHLIEQKAGDFNETIKIVIDELIKSQPHILSKVYNETYYATVLNYNIDSAFEKAWRDQLVKTPLISFYSAFTLACYDSVFKEQLM